MDISSGVIVWDVSLIRNVTSRCNMWDWGGFSYIYSMAIVGSRSPIPDGFWVVWEGPPIAATH